MLITSGMDERDERKRTSGDASKRFRRHQNWSCTTAPGRVWRKPTYWCRRDLCWNLMRAVSGRGEDIGSGSEVNRLVSEFLGEGLPPVDFAHGDLTRGEQCPEQHRCGLGRRQHGLGFDPALELFMEPLMALVVRTLFHWLRGSRVKVKSRSPASSRLSATALHLSRHLRRKARRRSSISVGEVA